MITQTFANVRQNKEVVISDLERQNKEVVISDMEHQNKPVMTDLEVCGIDITKFHGAIFDVDGTLLDSMSIWETIGADYLCAIGYEPKEKLNEILKTMSLKQAAVFFQREYGVLQSTEEIVDGVHAMLENYYQNQVMLKPGVEELLEKFYNAGVKICIATATDRQLVEPALSRLGICRFFDAIFTSHEVGHGKSEPYIYEEALAFLGSDKLETLVFEDALYAIQTAKKSGFCVVGVYDSHEKEQELVQALADFYIKKFD